MSNPSPLYPSIFNDVIGPAMRGPSSSHCAAALRIGRMARDLMGGRIGSARIQFDSNGSLATTHTSQGSDMGLLGGLLGWEATDDRLAGSTWGQIGDDHGPDARGRQTQHGGRLDRDGCMKSLAGLAAKLSRRLTSNREGDVS